MISIRLENVSEVSSVLKNLPSEIQRAAKSAVRAAVAEGKAAARDKVKARYTSPVSLFTSNLSTKINNLSGEIKVSGSRNPLDKFQNAPKGRITTRGRYIKAVVVRGQGGLLKSAFRKSSGDSIFERTGHARFPIRKLNTLSAPSMLNAVRAPVIQKITQALQNNFRI